MSKILLILTALFLSGCSATLSRLDAPTQIKEQNKVYRLTASQDLGSMARFVYLESGKNLENWQSALELLLDRNFENRTISERIALRKRVYRNTEVKYFKISPFKDKQTRRTDGLIGYVIYEPTAKNPNWQVDVVRGKNVPRCGFVQYQYSQRSIPKKQTTQIAKQKVIRYLKKYVAEKMVRTLSAKPWSFGCENKNEIK